MLIPFSLICLWTLVSGELGFNYMNWPCISLFNSGLASDKVTLFEIGTTDPIKEIGMLGLLFIVKFNVEMCKVRRESKMSR